jgi:hypothetical protein
MFRMQASEIGGPDHAGVVHELRNPERGFWVIAAGGQVLEKRCTDGVQQEFTGLCDASSENEQLRIQHGGEAGAGLPEPVAELPEGSTCARVASVDQGADVFATECAGAGANIGKRLTDTAGVRELTGHPLQGTT